MTCTGIVLAAGAGTRLGIPKAEVLLGGERLLDRAVGVLFAGGCDEVVAVCRPQAPPPLHPQAMVVTNPQPQNGLASSLRLGLEAASCERALLILVDLPGITADSVRRVRATPGEIVVATYAGRRGHPVAIARGLWAELRNVTGDVGARVLFGTHPQLVTEVACSGESHDLDTAEDLQWWSERLA